MPNKKKIRVKVKKRKLKIKNILILILLIILIYNMIIYILNLKISNIYIVNNSLLTDKEIINLANLSDYPSFILTSSKDIKTNLYKNKLIKEIKVKKELFGKIYIYITEYKPIAIYNNQLLLDNGSLIDNIYDLNLPIIKNDISSIYDDYIASFSLIDSDILYKISEIEYVPNDVDKERFLIYMTDGNYVYMTLNKITKLNTYNSIVDQLEGKHGIIYLDSGDYFEIKEESPS